MRSIGVLLFSTLLSLPMLGAFSGCGPVTSSYLIIDAQAKIDGAKTAEAERYALYEYTAAVEYLRKAREEQGYADFGPSIDFAYKAADLAKKAQARSKEMRGRETPVDGFESVNVEDTDESQKIEIVPIMPDEGRSPK